MVVRRKRDIIYNILLHINDDNYYRNLLRNIFVIVSLVESSLQQWVIVVISFITWMLLLKYCLMFPRRLHNCAFQILYIMSSNYFIYEIVNRELSKKVDNLDLEFQAWKKAFTISAGVCSIIVAANISTFLKDIKYDSFFWHMNEWTTKMHVIDFLCMILMNK